MAHKLHGMVDVVNRQCEHEGCMDRPIYGLPGSRSRFCGVHKMEGMVNVHVKRCLEQPCQKAALYGLEGAKAEYCTAHRKERMVNVTKRVCEQFGCSKWPTLGFPGGKATRCELHYTEGMRDTITINKANRGGNREDDSSIGHFGSNAGSNNARGSNGGDNANHRALRPEGELNTSSYSTPATSAVENGSSSVEDTENGSSTKSSYPYCQVLGCNRPPSFSPNGGSPAFCVWHSQSNNSLRQPHLAHQAVLHLGGGNTVGTFNGNTGMGGGIGALGGTMSSTGTVGWSAEGAMGSGISMINMGRIAAPGGVLGMRGPGWGDGGVVIQDSTGYTTRSGGTVGEEVGIGGGEGNGGSNRGSRDVDSNSSIVGSNSNGFRLSGGSFGVAVGDSASGGSNQARSSGGGVGWSAGEVPQHLIQPDLNWQSRHPAGAWGVGAGIGPGYVSPWVNTGVSSQYMAPCHRSPP
ncbi:unnamed protein product [Choristocarpus tenellus]